MSTTNRLLDNKQMIHIASEVVALIGLTFYFSSKNRKLSGHIEELAQRLEEQESHIKKLDNVIQQLTQRMSNLPFEDIANRIEGYETRMMGVENMVSNFAPKSRIPRRQVSRRTYQPKPQPKHQPKPQPRQPERRTSVARTTERARLSPIKEEEDYNQERHVSFQDSVDQESFDQEPSDEDNSDLEQDSDLDDEISQELKELGT